MIVNPRPPQLGIRPMAVCRIYLCTYRRNQLLRRAVNSLLTQTFEEWVCELHNDDPFDRFPADLVAEIADRRISIVTHPVNLGPTNTFNLFFRTDVAERYISILEDDNWWEPQFLETMVAEMDRRPAIQIGWANMMMWAEQADGGWRRSDRCVWDSSHSTDPLLFFWPNHRQIRGALHSQGAMLVRSSMIAGLVIPEGTPSAAMEHVRERLFTHPLMLVPQPLANFAVTRSTSRSRDLAQWGQCQVLLVASFLRHVRLGPDDIRQLWSSSRQSTPPSTHPLVAAGLIDSRSRYALAHSRPIDWFRFLASSIRRPVAALRILFAKRALPALWQSLDTSTAVLQARHGNPSRLVDDFPPPRSE